jgi:hypothetical protein
MLICVRKEKDLKGETLCGKKVEPKKEPLTQWIDYFLLVPRISMRDRYCTRCYDLATSVS